MAEGAILEPPSDEGVEEAPAQVPSVFSVINNYVIGGAGVSPPAEDGSRVLRLISQGGIAVVEANISAELCAQIAHALVAVEVIEEDDADAAPGN